MNFLAHLLLSGNNEDILVGNLMEDFIVGKIEHPRNSHIDSKYHKGIALHRKIDTFTDSHALVSASKALIYADFGKYASVAVDVYFDHFLAIHWQKYSDQDLQIFSNWVSKTFEAHWQNLPDAMKPMIESMIKHNWLKNYAEMWAIEKAFLGLSKRTKFEANFDRGVPALERNFDKLEEYFLSFFPEMMKVCEEMCLTTQHNTHDIYSIKKSPLKREI